MSALRVYGLIGLFALSGAAASAQPLKGVYVLPDAFEIGLTLSKVKMPAGTMLRQVESDSKLKVCSEAITVFQLGIPMAGHVCSTMTATAPLTASRDPRLQDRKG